MKGKDQNTGKEVALKILNLKELSMCQEYFKREVPALDLLKNEKGVVRI